MSPFARSKPGLSAKLSSVASAAMAILAANNTDNAVTIADAERLSVSLLQ